MKYNRAIHRVSSDFFHKVIRDIYGDANSDVQAVISKIVSVPNKEVGPGASKSSVYKNPEYFCYNSTSYFEAEIGLAKYRLNQPSNKTPLEPKR